MNGYVNINAYNNPKLFYVFGDIVTTSALQKINKILAMIYYVPLNIPSSIIRCFKIDTWFDL